MAKQQRWEWYVSFISCLACTKNLTPSTPLHARCKVVFAGACVDVRLCRRGVGRLRILFDYVLTDIL